MLGFSVSNGTAFLFTVIPTSSSFVSNALPVMCLLRKSINIKWLSVPPETKLKSNSNNRLAKA